MKFKAPLRFVFDPVASLVNWIANIVSLLFSPANLKLSTKSAIKE